MAPEISPDLVAGEDGLNRPRWATGSALLTDYYDTEWGLPVTSESGLLERVCLEGFQAGLSWATILRKRPALREAFAGFDAAAVAAFGDGDVARLMADRRIIRNERKIHSAINNARATLRLRERGGLPRLVWSHQPEETIAPLRLSEVPTRDENSSALARELKEAGFSFVGPTTMFAMMESIGVIDTHLVGSHRRGSSGLWRADGTRLRSPL